MKLHGNARTCPKSRQLLVERVESKTWSLTAAAEAAGVSERTAYRWLKRCARRAPKACSTDPRRRGTSRIAHHRSGCRRSRPFGVCT
jgi:transposase